MCKLQQTVVAFAVETEKNFFMIAMKKDGTAVSFRFSNLNGVARCLRALARTGQYETVSWSSGGEFIIIAL